MKGNLILGYNLIQKGGRYKLGRKRTKEKILSDYDEEYPRLNLEHLFSITSLLIHFTQTEQPLLKMIQKV